MDIRVEPQLIEVRRAASEVVVRWQDGHVTALPCWYLRGFCPCAECQGHGGQWDYVGTAAPVLRDVNEVGHYALNFTWEDGHSTGIYTFEALRELCPCAPCQAERGARHPWRRLPADVATQRV